MPVGNEKTNRYNGLTIDGGLALVSGDGASPTYLAADGTGGLLVNGMAAARPRYGSQSASKFPFQASVQPPQNARFSHKTRHVALSPTTAVRVQFGAPFDNESDGAAQPVRIKVGLEYNGTIYPVTFNGLATISFDAATLGPISDPVDVTIPSGGVFYTRSYISTMFDANTTLASAASIGDPTISLVALPGLAPGITGQTMTLNSGGSAEQVIVSGYTGTGPYTATLRAVLTKAHISGTVVGGQIFLNTYLFGDLGEGQINAVDRAWSGAITALGTASASTLAANTLAGDTTITVVAPIYGSTLTLAAETLTVVNVTGSANPYTIRLAAPLASPHTLGDAVTGRVYALGLAPVRVLCETADPVPSVVLIGDSIISGTGFLNGVGESFATLAFDGKRGIRQLGKAGESAQQFATPGTSYRRRSLIAGHEWAFIQYGVNDVYTPRTLVQIQGDILTILQFCQSRGVKVAISTLTPRTTSSDLWTTTVNQTITGVATTNIVRLQYNAWLRSGGSGADLVVDLADAVEVRGSSVWSVGSNGALTVDGIHPSYAGHVVLAAAIPVASFV